MSETFTDQSTLAFRGRDYILFRRGGANYSIRAQVNNRRMLKGLKTSSLAVARARAKVWLSEILEANGSEFTEEDPVELVIPTIGELLQAYKEGEETVREATSIGNANRLLALFRSVTGKSDDQIKKLPVAAVTVHLAKAWQAQRQRRAEPSYTAVLEGNIGANSVLRQARSIFSPRAREKYTKKNWMIPKEVDAFCKVPMLKEPSTRFIPIPQAVINELKADLPNLKAQDERLWACALMALLMGMRCAEMFRAHKGWMVEVEPGKWVLQIVKVVNEDAPKRSEGKIPIPDMLVEYFQRQKDLLIPGGSYGERRVLIYITLAEWVRKFIPDRNKATHELRKQFGSVIYQQTGSLDAAAEALRVTPIVAYGYYAALTQVRKPLGLDSF